MVQYEVITEVAPRKSIYPYRAVFLPRLISPEAGSEENNRWCEENWWMVDYFVTIPNKEKANQLSSELYSLWENDKGNPRIIEIVEELRVLRAKNVSDFDSLEQWSWSAQQMVNYAGDQEEWEAIWSALDDYHGNVLEAFCGHHSYFKTSSNRQIVALDYCVESLMRYKHPDALRICCDLNQVSGGKSLQFLKAEYFDTVSICFGYKYPDDICAIINEFRRVLKTQGKLSFVESKSHEYQKCKKRDFSRATLKRQLALAGFNIIKQCKLGNTDLWHTEAIK